MNSIFDIPRDLLALWHSWRLPLLASALVIGTLVAARNTQYLQAPPTPPSSTTTANRDEVKTKPDEEVGLLGDGHAEDDTVENILERFEAQTKKRAPPRTFTANKKQNKTKKRQPTDRANLFDHERDQVRPIVFYSSLGGTTEQTAQQFGKDIGLWSHVGVPSQQVLVPEVLDLAYIELDDYFVSVPKMNPNIKYFYLMLIPSYDIDTSLNNFIEHLQETHNDFRIDTAPLQALVGYSVFGFGDKEGWPTEEQGFCYQAKEVDKWLAKLSHRKRAYPMGLGDVKSDADTRFDEWQRGVQDALQEILDGKGLGEGVPGSGDPVESDEDDDDNGEEDMEEYEPPSKPKRQKRRAQKDSLVDDLEELGNMVRDDAAPQENGAAEEDEDTKAPIPIDFTTYNPSKPSNDHPAQTLKEMVPTSSPTYANLTKQGYSIIGSHSGVKICRWTKSALRGRGSCYKYSFYGIQSHLCMEATPSLSCSNKCVFCWRHGTNPVGTTWRWVTDSPDMIFSGITTAHYKKIKALKGVPGVRAERFSEAMRIRHCALSLVGEPIFYPYINELLGLLHNQRISTFLVCNAQHPQQLATLIPVTQLYVSIDASNKESLRKIDRPLHRDFWERFCACLDILRARRHEQRTVFRLTLVKGFNIDEEALGYADLVQRALPSFVEIKGVTYCGTSASSAAGLTMQNVPFYHEICTFVRALDEELNRRGLDYGIAAEHEHSCCVLLASKRFYKRGRWCTRIDYGRFFELVENGKEDGEGWGPEDYVDESGTPEWALWGNGGFDPRDTRVYRKGKNKKPLPTAASQENEEETKTNGVKKLVEI